MFTSTSLKARRARFLNLWHARAATCGAAPPTGFVSMPEPRTIGSPARGAQLLAGDYRFAGLRIETPDTSLWALTPPSPAYAAELHGFAWLDDLAALGSAASRKRAQRWLWEWTETYGRGEGPGWTPDLTGRRLMRWINHAAFLLRGRGDTAREAFYRSLQQQTRFLARRWHGAAPGLARFEALGGLICAGLSLEGRGALADPAIRALAQECDRLIDDEGGLPTRNPEELLSVLTLLTSAAAALSDAGRGTPAALLDAIERIAPTLRSLRHADGGLARFHGGGRGAEGWLDQALAAARVRKGRPDGLAMGYARLSAGRSSVIVDAATPPIGVGSGNAHASTLAFELTSGRRSLVVSCGSGASFGAAWRRAGRATPSHSTLILGQRSSARLADPDPKTGIEALVEGPRHVPVELSPERGGRRFQGGHDGYVPSHGLTHARTLDLTLDGRGLFGEDMLLALTDAQKRRFDAARDSADPAGTSFEIRFHLHPEVAVTLDPDDDAVSLMLRSGEIWMFRHDGTRNLALEPSVYLDSTRPEPRATQQIVLFGEALTYASRVRWSLSKAQETAIGVRDLFRDDPFPADD
ncbi:heparinase II/III family protein [Sulfitobacter aestuarii]|uniref:Heparinase II/III family protein n=1 Tax=Sulfitobacter aestuarii TaxID=2161676 RepID=A0ABW5U1N4_9RHOB